MSKAVEEFFDRLAPNWDDNECIPLTKKLYLIDKVGLKKGDQVIDIGCGTGVITNLIYEKTQTTVEAIDISSEMIEIAKRKFANKNIAQFDKADFYELPENNKFDVAIIYNAYPHFIDRKAFAIKLSKILNQNGKFAILHSMSISQLKKHHNGISNNISRDVLSLDDEVNNFNDLFEVIDSNSTDDYFYIIGKKKVD